MGMRVTKWTKEADMTLMRLWPEHGANWDGWKDALGFECSSKALYTRVSRLGCGVGKIGKRPYTEEEERELERLVAVFCKRHDRNMGSVVRKLESLYRRSLMKRELERSRSDRGDDV